MPVCVPAAKTDVPNGGRPHGPATGPPGAAASRGVFRLNLADLLQDFRFHLQLQLVVARRQAGHANHLAHATVFHHRTALAHLSRLAHLTLLHAGHRRRGRIGGQHEAGREGQRQQAGGT